MPTFIPPRSLKRIDLLTYTQRVTLRSSVTLPYLAIAMYILYSFTTLPKCVHICRGLQLSVCCEPICLNSRLLAGYQRVPRIHNARRQIGLIFWSTPYAVVQLAMTFRLEIMSGHDRPRSRPFQGLSRSQLNPLMASIRYATMLQCDSVHLLRSRHTTSTSMYSLTSRVCVMLP